MSVLVLVGGPARAADDTFGVGDGGDGPLIVDAGTLVINRYAVLRADANAGSSRLAVSSVDGFSAWKLVMVLQTTGLATTASGESGPFKLSGPGPGQWELARLESISSPPSTLALTKSLVASFPANNTQVILVPEYTEVTIGSAAMLTATPWDGGSGGVLAFFATGEVRNQGEISVSGMGFRGGPGISDVFWDVEDCKELDEPVPSRAGYKGEGVAAGRYGPDAGGRGNVANGGGGGDCNSAGGGGGANGGQGGKGGRSFDPKDGGRDVGGLGGAPLDYSLVDRLPLGGGGGAGHGEDGQTKAGGAGGGAIFIRAGSLSGTGTIAASGASALDAGLSDSGVSDGASGGGAGGSVYLRFIGAAACGGIQANGGNGGSSPENFNGPGGGGGGGRVLLQASSAASCSTSVIAGIAGTQTDPATPPHHGALPADASDPAFAGAVETLDGGYSVLPPADASLGLDYRAAACGCSQPGYAALLVLALGIQWLRRRGH